jgi:hypothetical protein
MAKILVLAKSGFGKTTSYSGREKLGIKGLNPKETYVIQCIGRGVPNPNFKLVKDAIVVENAGRPTQRLANANILATGNRIQVDTLTGLDRFVAVAEIINVLKKAPYKNIIIDDFNYLAQDFYMANAMKGGWETPKQIGYGMGLIFDAFKGLPEDKNLICCAHYEEYKDKNGDSISYKFKSTGKMVDDYITPEGQFDIVLFGKVGYDAEKKKPIKTFVKEFDGEYPAKDSLGVLDDLPDEIPNDLSIVVDKLKEIYGEE